MRENGRRKFLGAACALLAALQPADPALAQPKVVGGLLIGSPEGAIWRPAFEDVMRAHGYRDPQSLSFEYRFARGDISQYPRLARELIDRGSAVIFTTCGPALRAIRDISRTLPVVAVCSDATNFQGEVETLARPGGYTTGMTFLAPESVGKRVELLREMHPGLSRIAVLHEPLDPIDAHMRELERLRPILGLTLQRVSFGQGEKLEVAFETIVRERTQALFLLPTNRILFASPQIADLALKHRILTVFEVPFGPNSGGLLSYGWSTKEVFTKTAPMYLNKILKGAKPGDLPILQPTRFELVINLKTARAIGVTVPQSLLIRADSVIE